MQILKIANKDQSFQYQFYCPACKMRHAFNEAKQFNQDFKKPSITEAMTINGTKMNNKGEFEKFVCSFTISGGTITYGGNSTHEMSGKSAELPDAEITHALNWPISSV